MDSVESAVLVERKGIAGNADQGGKRQGTIRKNVMGGDDAGAGYSGRSGGTPCQPDGERNFIGRNPREKTVVRKGLVQIFGQTRQCGRLDEVLPVLQEIMRHRWRGGVFGIVLSGQPIKISDRTILHESQ